MRTARRALGAMSLSLAVLSSTAAPSRAAGASPPEVPGSPSWAKDSDQTGVGFSSLSVTQSGVTYAPADGTIAPEGLSGAPLSDLPAWAAPAQARSPPRSVLATLGFGRGGNLPEPAVWGLMLAGFAIIGGALRGLILANRRLDRLRAEEEPDEEP